MTIDVREVLDDLAGVVSPPDLAEAAITGARRRRRRAWAGGAVTVTALVIASITIPSALERNTTTPPASPSDSSPRYDPTVDKPWPFVRDLPSRLDEPLALTYTFDAVDPRTRAVAASGRQWDLGHNAGIIPSLSADGWHIAYYDASSSRLVVADLRSGEAHRYDLEAHIEGQREAIYIQEPMPWSPDGSQVAVRTYIDGIATYIEVLSAYGPIRKLTMDVDPVGWVADDTLLVITSSTGPQAAVGPTLEAVTLDGERRVLSHAAWPPDVALGSNNFSLSPDGRTLAGTRETDYLAADVVSIEVESGRVSSVPCLDCVAAYMSSWVSATEVLGETQSPVGGTTRFVAINSTSGATRDLLTVSPRLDNVNEVRVAVNVMSAGADGHAYTSKSWMGWYLDYITYGLAGLLVLMIALAVAIPWAVRRRRLTTRDTASA